MFLICLIYFISESFPQLHSKYICVLIGKSHMCYAKHICVFNLWGLFVEYTFGRTLIISKMRWASPILAISRKHGIAQKCFSGTFSIAPPFFSQSSVPDSTEKKRSRRLESCQNHCFSARSVMPPPFFPIQCLPDSTEKKRLQRLSLWT